MADPRARKVAAVAVALAVVAGITAFLLAGPPAHRGGASGARPMAGRDVSQENWGGPFTLTDMDGHARTLADFRGKVVMLTFGYTHCPDVCPTTLAKFAEVRRLLGEGAAARVQGLFVTVDPERDTAQLLHAYVPQFDPSFIGLRGTEVQTDAVTRAYHANYQIVETPGGTLVDHTAFTYLIDAAGRLRVVEPYDQPARAVADDVGALIADG